MLMSLRKMLTDNVIDNLLVAQKNMASAETVDVRSLILLSRFILRLLKQLDNELIELGTEAEESTTDWCGNEVGE